jgi:hypothetical protein
MPLNSKIYSFIWDDKPDKVKRFNFSGLLLGWPENDKLKGFYSRA